MKKIWKFLYLYPTKYNLIALKLIYEFLKNLIYILNDEIRINLIILIIYKK